MHIKALFEARRQGASAQRIGRIMTLDQDHRPARRAEPAQAWLALLPIGFPSAEGAERPKADTSKSMIAPEPSSAPGPPPPLAAFGSE